MNKRKVIIQTCMALIVILYIATCVVTHRFMQMSNDPHSLPIISGILNLIIGILLLVISKNLDEGKKKRGTKFLGYFFSFGMLALMIFAFLGGYKFYI